MDSKSNAGGIATASAIYAGLSVFTLVYFYIGIEDVSNDNAVLLNQGIYTVDVFKAGLESAKKLSALLKLNCIVEIFIYVIAWLSEYRWK